MEIAATLEVSTRRAFRRWLQEHHSEKSEIWLVQYKKATGKPSIDYGEAVEEAICFGWIDGIVKSMNAERFARRFTPRRPRSNWSATNLQRARRMIAERKMTPAGMKAMPAHATKQRRQGARTDG